MTQEVVRRCPHCGKRAPQALLPCPGGEADPHDLEGASSAAHSRRYYCLQCRAIWQSLELPASQWEAALARAEQVEELQRQVAMLRFLLASLRQQQEQALLSVADAPRRLAA